MAGALGYQGSGWMGRAVGGSSGNSGSPWQWMGDPYKERELKMQEEGQNFGQDLARAKFGLQQNAYSQFMPMAQQLMGQFGQVGGQSSGMPQINQSPIYSQQQQQQGVNAGVAANDARYQTLMRQLAGTSANRGFAGGPAMNAQQAQLGIANIGENARTERELPAQYAQANADQTYRTDVARQNQWAQGQDLDVRRRQTQLQGMQAMLSQLAGLI